MQYYAKTNTRPEEAFLGAKWHLITVSLGATHTSSSKRNERKKSRPAHDYNTNRARNLFSLIYRPVQFNLQTRSVQFHTFVQLEATHLTRDNKVRLDRGYKLVQLQATKSLSAR